MGVYSVTQEVVLNCTRPFDVMRYLLYWIPKNVKFPRRLVIAPQQSSLELGEMEREELLL